MPCHAECSAQILLHTEGDSLQVQGCLRSEQSDTLRYHLSIRKSGPAGSTTAQQGGEVRLLAGQRLCPAKGRYSLANGDHYRFELSIYREGRLVETMSREYP